jgi:hypothetical protein
MSAAEQVLLELAEHPDLDQDDVAATYYTLESVTKRDSHSALWAAQRAYEARDAQAQDRMAIDRYTPEIEGQLLQHASVQRELHCQMDDIALLKHGSSGISAVIKRAQNAA